MHWQALVPLTTTTPTTHNDQSRLERHQIPANPFLFPFPPSLTPFLPTPFRSEIFPAITSVRYDTWVEEERRGRVPWEEQA